MSRVQIAVVGGGPAGLSAAIAAAHEGAQVVLFDENRALGGQLRYRLGTPSDAEPWAASSLALAETLIAEARQAEVHLWCGAVVWGLFASGVLAVSEPDGADEVEAEQIVLATGSTDLPCPFPGGSLPGVLTARAIQILLHIHRVLPARRIAIIGTGVEADEAARDIESAGGHVVVRIDPVRTGQDVAAEGDDGVRGVTVSGTRYNVEAIVVAIGRQPDAELALMAECDAGYSADLGGFVPLRDANLRCSVPGIIVAGDAGGICDVATAIAEGSFAGLSAAAALGLVAENRLDAAREAYVRAVGDRAAAVSSLITAPMRV